MNGRNPHDESAKHANGWSCSHLDWFRTNTLAVGYFHGTEIDDDDKPTHEAALHIVELLESNASTPVEVRSASNLGDVIPFSKVTGKHVYWTAATQTLDSSQPLLFVASNVGSDIAVVARTGYHGADAWSVVELADAITTPIGADDEFIFPTGIAIRHGRLLVSSTDGALTVLSPSVDLMTVSITQPPSLSAALPVFPPSTAASFLVNISTTSGIFSSRAISDVAKAEPHGIINDDVKPHLIEGDNEPALLSVVSPTAIPSFVAPVAVATASTLSGQTSSVQPSSKAAETAPSILGQTDSTLGRKSNLFGLPAATTWAYGQTSIVPSKVPAESSAQQTWFFGGTSSTSSNGGLTFTPSTSTRVATSAATSAVFGSGTTGPVFGSSSGTPSLGGSEKASRNHESPFDAFAKINVSSPDPIFSMAKPLFGTPTRVQHDGKPKKENAVVVPTTHDVKSQESTVGPGEKASDGIDSLDTNKVGSLPIDRIEELLDALGEGFHGEELSYQVAVIDPTEAGQLERTAFVEWYTRLAEGRDAITRHDKDGTDSSLPNQVSTRFGIPQPKRNLATISSSTFGSEALRGFPPATDNASRLRARAPLTKLQTLSSLVFQLQRWVLSRVGLCPL